MTNFFSIGHKFLNAPYLRWLPHRFRENQPALAVLVLLILVIIFFAGSMSTGGGAASSALGSSRTSKASGGQNIRPVSSLHYDLTVKAESLVDMMDHASQPQNPGFVFHNKMPKSGSTTVQRLLRTLSNKNHFFYMDMYEHGTNDQDFVVVDAIKENFQMPLQCVWNLEEKRSKNRISQKNPQKTQKKTQKTKKLKKNPTNPKKPKIFNFRFF